MKNSLILKNLILSMKNTTVETFIEIINLDY